MHGDASSPKLPVFGNKVIAVKDNGRIEMHGKPRAVTWTSLHDTADVGATWIQLYDVPNTWDWQVDEVIVIASTDFEGRHAE